MRILFICEGYRPGTDACAKRIGVFVDHLKSRGYDVDVLASSINLANGVAVDDVRYCVTKAMSKNKTAVQRFLSNASFCRSAIKESRMLEAADVVVVTSPPLLSAPAGLRIAKRMNARLIFDVRDVWPEVAFEMGSFSPRSLYGAVFSRIATLMYRHADKITVVTAGKKSKLVPILNKAGIDDSKIHLVGNGLDETFLDQDIDEDFVEKHRLGEAFSCVYVGNLGMAQGLTALLDLAERVKKLYPTDRFYLFGSGAEEILLKQRTAEKNLDNVIFGGVINPRQAYTALKTADMSFVSLLNSKMTSSVPTKLYEALGCGCPVLLAAKGDAESVLDETSYGVSVHPESVEEIVEGYMYIRKNHDSITANRAKAIFSIRENHSRQLHAAEFEKILLEVVED